MIKYELQYYDNLLNSKHQLNAELKDVQSLLNKVTNSITELQKSSLTEEEVVQLAEYEKQKIELLTRLNEIAQSFNSVNQEIGAYNVEKIEEAKELISTVVEFSKINEEIKTAEKLSKKSNSPKIILENAEGRKKEIAEELVDDYKILITKKKELMNEQRLAYKKLNDMPSLKEQKEVLQQIEKSEQVVSSTESVEEVDYFEKLSLEEQIDETKKRIDRIIKTGELPNQGKKKIINYNGQKYSIPKVYYGKFSETIGLLKKLEQEKLEKNNQQEVETVSSLSDMLEVKNESQPTVSEQQPVEKSEELSAIITKKRKVPNIKEIIKQRWKPVIAAALALTMSATMFVACLSKKGAEQINNYNNVQTVVETNDIDEFINENPLEDKLNFSLDNETSVDNFINIGTIVSVNENAPIYNNMYDATNGSNQLNQMYPGNNMSVLGIVFNVNNNLVFVTDANQIDELKNMGCEITSYAVSLDGNNITGFYNAGDINVNTLEGEKTL